MAAALGPTSNGFHLQVIEGKSWRKAGEREEEKRERERKKLMATWFRTF